MRRSVNEYDEGRGGGMGKKLAQAAVPLGGLAGAAGMVGLTKMAVDNSKQGKVDREAAAEIKRESRGVSKPANFDAIEEAKQEVKDAAARKKISDMGYAKGGVTRADGIAKRGKTRGKMC